MLYESDLTLYDIQDFCAETLKNNADFTTYCVSEIGESLNFETDAVLNDEDMLPALPYCSVHSGEEEHNLLQGEWGHEYKIGLVFGISDTTSATDPRPPSTIDSDIKKYTSSRKIENIAKKALLTIKSRMRASGINGDYDIQIVSVSGVKTPTGEADDMNYIMSISFNYLETIQKGC